MGTKIVSPWALAQEDIRRHETPEESPRPDGEPGDAPAPGLTVLDGRSYVIHVLTPRASKHAPVDGAFGRAILAGVLQDLLAAVPQTKLYLRRQYVFTEPGPATQPLQIDTLVLHAKVGSLAPELARLMAVDRLVAALLETCSMEARAAALLRDAGVTLVRRA